VVSSESIQTTLTIEYGKCYGDGAKRRHRKINPKIGIIKAKLVGKRNAYTQMELQNRKKQSVAFIQNQNP